MKHNGIPKLRALIIIAVLGLLRSAKAGLDLGYGVPSGDDSDLTNFITRPEIKVPRFNVSVYKPDEVVPGYWFVGPYANVQQEHIARKYYQPCQTGPTIYDATGVSGT